LLEEPLAVIDVPVSPKVPDGPVFPDTP